MSSLSLVKIKMVQTGALIAVLIIQLEITMYNLVKALWALAIIAFILPIQFYGRAYAETNSIQSEERVTIDGSGLTGAMSVTFDGLVAQFVVVSDTLITAVKPAVIKDRALVEVKTPGGTVNFEYIKAPDLKGNDERPPITLASIDPTFGPALGGTVIRIKGSGFKQKGSLRVLLDGVDATAVSRVREDELVAITPPHPSGIARLMVKSMDGMEVSLDKAFTFVAPPSVATITPMTAPAVGGAVVEIRGAGFSTVGDVMVVFGRTPAKEVTVRSEGEIIAVTPPYIEGPVDLLIANPDGQSTEVKGVFSYLPTPVIKSVSSPEGIR